MWSQIPDQTSFLYRGANYSCETPFTPGGVRPARVYTLPFCAICGTGIFGYTEDSARLAVRAPPAVLVSSRPDPCRLLAARDLHLPPDREEAGRTLATGL